MCIGLRARRTTHRLWSGILTGKYSNGIPEGSRMSNPMNRAFISNFDEKVAKTKQLEPIAKEIGATMTEFALAWVAANENVSTVLLGATSVAQLDENLKALAFVDKITPEIRAKVDAVVQFQPQVVPSADAWVHGMRTQFL